jgi:hypothetical protein
MISFPLKRQKKVFILQWLMCKTSFYLERRSFHLNTFVFSTQQSSNYLQSSHFFLFLSLIHINFIFRDIVSVFYLCNLCFMRIKCLYLYVTQIYYRGLHEIDTLNWVYLCKTLDNLDVLSTDHPSFHILQPFHKERFAYQQATSHIQ